MKSRLTCLKFQRNTITIFSSVVLSFLFVALISYAATTISTNVNTGGTLTVSGASNLNGNVTFGDAAGDVILSTGGFQASSTALFGGAVTLYANTALSGALGLTLGSSASDITGAAGMIYYNSGSNVVRLHDGSNWFTLGTTTSGLTLSGNRLQLGDLNYFTTFGTTTQQGLSMLTVEATSTAAIPLTLVARAAQTANTFQIRDAGSANLLYVNSAGGIFGSSTAQFTGALTTYGNVTLGDAITDVITLTGNSSTTNSLTVGGNFWVNGRATTTSAGALSTEGAITTQGTIWASSTAFVTGALTTYGNVTLGDAASDAIVITGNASTTNGLTVGGVASTSQLIVGGTGTDGTLSGLVFGYCNIVNPTVTASTTVAANCTSATGIRAGDRVFVQATTSLASRFEIVSASSSATDIISLYIYNNNWDGGANTTGQRSLNFIGIR